MRYNFLKIEIFIFIFFDCFSKKIYYYTIMIYILVVSLLSIVKIKRFLYQSNKFIMFIYINN